MFRSLANIKYGLTSSKDETFILQAEFITTHANGDHINVETYVPFNKDKNFDGVSEYLFACKFFKWLGGIFEEELKKLAMHHLKWTKRQSYEWPKVVVHNSFANLPNTYSAENQIVNECKMRKKDCHLAMA